MIHELHSGAFPVKFVNFSVAACAVAIALPASAADKAAPPANPGWTVTLRANGYLAPQYEGSKTLAPMAAPGFGLRRAGTEAAFSTPDDSISYALFDAGWLKAGPAGRFKSARRARDHNELAGLRDVDWTIEGGVFAEIWPMEKLRARVEALRNFHGPQGVDINSGVDWVEKTGAWTLALGPRLSIANDHFMRAYFSVTPAEALLSGNLGAYRAKSGIKSYGVAGSANYRWNQSWDTTFYGGYDRLAHAAAASPIVAKTGSRNQFTVGAIVAYSFDVEGFKLW